MNRFIAIIALVMVSVTAQAGLILHISPDGTGGTRWEFSGSTIAVSSGSSNSFWGENSGTLANGFNANYGITSGSGFLSSTSGGTHSVIDVWSSEHTYDGISPRVSSISWSAGDVLSWNGDLTSDSPFAGLNLGTISADRILGTDILEPLTVTVSNTSFDPQEVPEPVTLALLGLGLAGISLQRRKNAA